MKQRAVAAQAPDQGRVVTKAVLNAARHLDVSQKVLSAILGISEASVSRLRTGAFTLAPGEKSFELAVLFIRLFRALDATVSGDGVVARAWLRNHNTALDARPLQLIQSITGLTRVVAYLDTERAHV